MVRSPVRYGALLMGALFVGCTSGSSRDDGTPENSGTSDGSEDSAGEDTGSIEAGDSADVELPWIRLMWGYLGVHNPITGFQMTNLDQDYLCRVSYPVTEWSFVELCEGCVLAASMVRGDWEIIDKDVNGECEAQGWTGLSGTELSIGFGTQPEETAEGLWLDQGEGWQFFEEATGQYNYDKGLAVSFQFYFDPLP